MMEYTYNYDHYYNYDNSLGVSTIKKSDLGIPSDDEVQVIDSEVEEKAEKKKKKEKKKRRKQLEQRSSKDIDKGRSDRQKKEKRRGGGIHKSSEESRKRIKQDVEESNDAGTDRDHRDCNSSGERQGRAEPRRSSSNTRRDQRYRHSSSEDRGRGSRGSGESKKRKFNVEPRDSDERERGRDRDRDYSSHSRSGRDNGQNGRDASGLRRATKSENVDRTGGEANHHNRVPSHSATARTLDEEQEPVASLFGNGYRPDGTEILYPASGGAPGREADVLYYTGAGISARREAAEEAAKIKKLKRQYGFSNDYGSRGQNNAHNGFDTSSLRTSIKRDNDERDDNDANHDNRDRPRSDNGSRDDNGPNGRETTEWSREVKVEPRDNQRDQRERSRTRDRPRSYNGSRDVNGQNGKDTTDSSREVKVEPKDRDQRERGRNRDRDPSAHNRRRDGNRQIGSGTADLRIKRDIEDRDGGRDNHHNRYGHSDGRDDDRRGDRNDSDTRRHDYNGSGQRNHGDGHYRWKSNGWRTDYGLDNRMNGQRFHDGQYGSIQNGRRENGKHDSRGSGSGDNDTRGLTRNDKRAEDKKAKIEKKRERTPGTGPVLNVLPLLQRRTEDGRQARRYCEEREADRRRSGVPDFEYILGDDELPQNKLFNEFKAQQHYVSPERPQKKKIKPEIVTLSDDDGELYQWCRDNPVIPLPPRYPRTPSHSPGARVLEEPEEKVAPLFKSCVRADGSQILFPEHGGAPGSTAPIPMLTGAEISAREEEFQKAAAKAERKERKARTR